VSDHWNRLKANASRAPRGPDSPAQSGPSLVVRATAPWRDRQPCSARRPARPGDRQAGTPQEVTGGHPKSLGKPDKHVDRDVLSTRLDVLQIPVRQPGPFAERLLRQAQSRAPAAHVRSDVLQEFPVALFAHLSVDTLAVQV
jgi:hypothetical protein